MASLFMTMDSDDEKMTAEKTDKENDDQILLAHSCMLHEPDNKDPQKA
jgi:hypothetical protein